MRALLVECIVPRSKPRMDEVNDITKAAGYNVVGQVIQHQDSVDPTYCVGKGKIDEIEKTVKEDLIETIIFTRQLSAGQVLRIKISAPSSLPLLRTF